jgi:hypothetical protein
LGTITDKIPETGERKSLKLIRLGLIGVTLVLAFVIYDRWPKPPLDPRDPSTWPVTERRAVILAREAGVPCPPSRLAWQFEGTQWREVGTWLPRPGSPASAATEWGILCLRAEHDFGPLTKIGTGAEDQPDSAIFASVIEKDGSCPKGTNYEAGNYCLKSTPLPPAPDIAP